MQLVKNYPATIRENWIHGLCKALLSIYFGLYILFSCLIFVLELVIGLYKKDDIEIEAMYLYFKISIMVIVPAQIIAIATVNCLNTSWFRITTHLGYAIGMLTFAAYCLSYMSLSHNEPDEKKRRSYLNMAYLLLYGIFYVLPSYIFYLIIILVPSSNRKASIYYQPISIYNRLSFNP